MPKKPTSKKTQNSAAHDAEQLGKLLASVYESHYVSLSRLLKWSFLRGFVQGVGGFLGATVGAGVLIWIASIILDLPILGSILEMLREAFVD